jgi:NADPH-dependent glutamate synthase beta subunit-like oxidoreductase/xanthine dehydrogenase iron-sulfur cluster and FAD-binding subunit A
MKDFTYIRPATLEEVADVMDKQTGRIVLLAGGTDLLGTMKDDIHKEYPSVVIDLKGIPGLRFITYETGQAGRQEDGYEDGDKEGHEVSPNDGVLRIGALTTLHEIAADPLVREKCRILAQAAEAVASQQLRRVGTLGGNICQEPRCWYYRYPENEFPCLRKGGDLCYALTGENEIHSIFGAAKIGKSACETYCPIEIGIPAYLEQLREGDVEEAAAILFSVNPFAAVTGRVCPHFCQAKCNRGEFDDEVQIRNIGRYVGDYILENGDTYFVKPQYRIGKSVAVVGSGPAGLAAAFFLTTYGFGVTVYEKESHPGGMLYYGVPEFRLPKQTINTLITYLEQMGIEFNLDTEIGKVIGFDQLRSENDAVFLAPGAAANNTMGIPGEEHTESGLAFLHRVTEGQADLQGKRVAVIGGGNVAIDCARSAVRLGAEETHLIYRRSKPEMPAYDEEVAEAEEEGVQFHFLRNPTGVTLENGSERGKGSVRMVRLIEMELGKPDASGRGSVRPVPESGETMDFDFVIMAIGQKLDRKIIHSIGIPCNKNGFFDVYEESFATPLKDVYAGGDAVNKGPLSVVEAIYAGKRAASVIAASFGVETVIHESVNGREGYRYKLAGEGSGVSKDSLLGCSDDALSPSATVSMPMKAPEMRELAREDSPGLDSNNVRCEAERCFNCGCVDVNISDLASVLVVLDAKIITNRREIGAGQFFSAGKNSTTSLHPGEIVTEVDVPLSSGKAAGTRLIRRFLKYRIRKSIDFAKVSVTLDSCVKDRRIDTIRIVFGGIAPVPFRIRPLEDYLTGKLVNTETMEGMGKILTEHARLLKKNRYKLAILQTYIKRILMSAE